MAGWTYGVFVSAARRVFESDVDRVGGVGL